MKRLVLYICVFCIVSSALAQRYDYDDIYFNPKKDIKPVVVETPKEVVEEEKVAPTAEGGYSDDGLSYTARINMFHRNDGDTAQDRLAHIADPNYTTNVFVLTDGQYVVDVDGDNIEISENYNYPYMDWSNAYWNYPYYYGPYYSSSYYWNRSMYGWYGSYYGGYGWSVGYYDPYFYGFYNPWYDPFYSPYWGYSGCYYDHYCGHHHHYYGHHHHHHHHGYYPNYGSGSHHPKPDWGDYVARGNENERRNINSSSRLAANVAASNRVATTATSSAVRRVNDAVVSTSNVRGRSTSTASSVANTQRHKTTTSVLPARPTTTREVTPTTSSSSRSTSVNTTTSTSTRRSTSTVRSSSTSTTTTRTSSTYRPSSSSTRSSGGFSGGSSSGGGRSGGSSSSSTRRR